MGIFNRLFNSEPNISKDNTDVSALIKALSYDSSVQIRADAAKALDRLGWKPEITTEKVYYYIAKQNWNEVSKLKNDALEPLLIILCGDNKDFSKGPRKFWEIIEIVLIKILLSIEVSQPQIQILSRYLEKAHPTIKVFILNVIGETKISSMSKNVAQLIYSSNDSVRLAAIRALILLKFKMNPTLAQNYFSSEEREKILKYAFSAEGKIDPRGYFGYPETFSRVIDHYQKAPANLFDLLFQKDLKSQQELEDYLLFIFQKEITDKFIISQTTTMVYKYFDLCNHFILEAAIHPIGRYINTNTSSNKEINPGIIKFLQYVIMNYPSRRLSFHNEIENILLKFKKYSLIEIPNFDPKYGYGNLEEYLKNMPTMVEEIE